MRKALEGELRAQRVEAPAGLSDRVLAALPPGPEGTWADRLWGWWPDPRPWALPVGMAAAVLALAGGAWWMRQGAGEQITVQFVLHAPEAAQVELLGSFTGWGQDKLVLQGPDATGHWSASLQLPPGQYEYMFLVDGQEWRTDPAAMYHRPDGFGRENAVLEVTGPDLGG
jgi:hypothetical protein